MSYFLINDFDIATPLNNADSLLLIIENKEYLYSVLQDIYGGCNEKEFIKIIDDNNKQLKTSDFIDFIYSLVFLDINNKKNNNALIRRIKSLCNGNINDAILNVRKELSNCFKYISLESPIDILSNEDLTEDEIIKLMNISINDSTNDLLERINLYINVCYELRNIKIFVFFNLFSYLDEDKITKLIHQCKYNEIKIIDIEQSYKDTVAFDIVKILDNDICLIE